MLLQNGGIPIVIISSAQMACEVRKTQDLIFASRPPLSEPMELIYDCRERGDKKAMIEFFKFIGGNSVETKPKGSEAGRPPGRPVCTGQLGRLPCRPQQENGQLLSRPTGTQEYRLDSVDRPVDRVLGSVDRPVD